MLTIYIIKISISKICADQNIFQLFLSIKYFLIFGFFPMIWEFQSVAKTPIGPAQNVDGPHAAVVARTRYHSDVIGPCAILF